MVGSSKEEGGKRGGGGYVHSLLERTGVKGVSLSLVLRWRRRSLSSLLGRRVSPDSVAPPREKRGGGRDKCPAVGLSVLLLG